MNYIKTRDDNHVACFATKAGTPEEKEFEFIPPVPETMNSLQDGSGKPAWIDKTSFGQKELRQRIEPWLTALFQSEHLSLLVGSGMTHAVHCLAQGKPATGMRRAEFPQEAFGDKIKAYADHSATECGRKVANFEDDIRVANELLQGMKISGCDKAGCLEAELTNFLKKFADGILASEQGIASAEAGKREDALGSLVNFLMSFASRTGTRDRLNIFTTNYDRLIEAGAELAGLHLVDRFVGNLAPIFRSSRLDIDMHYNPPGIRGEPRYLEGVARFTKLHGSVDWIQAEDDIRRIGLPFGARSVSPYLDAPGMEGAKENHLMIYPNSSKDIETSMYPYVELFRDFASALCRPNSTLVTYGYSFGDEHINRVIRDMLTIPSTHLVVISRDDKLNRISALLKKTGRLPQISLLVGPELADLKTLTENFLPKAAIDRTSSKMSDLLRTRFGTKQSEEEKNKPAPPAEEEA